MKNYRIVLVLALALILATGLSVLGVNSGDASSNLEMAVVEFPYPVKLGASLLKGTYLFAHRDITNEEWGCLLIYRVKDGKPGKLVTSIHCQRRQREMATEFQVRTVQVMPTLKEVTEVQFANSAIGHAIPK